MHLYIFLLILCEVAFGGIIIAIETILYVGELSNSLSVGEHFILGVNLWPSGDFSIKF